MLFRILSILSLILFSALPIKAGNTDIFSKHCPMGCPTTKNKDLAVVMHESFISAINKKNRHTVWVAYKVDGEKEKTASRIYFKADPLLPKSLQQTRPEFTGLNKKYKLDRGHMAPYGTFNHDKKLSDPTFYFSNIIPQPENLNRKIWVFVEALERKNAPMSVIAGAYGDDFLNRKFWKVVLSGDKEVHYALIFEKQNNEYCYRNIRINKLEKLTGLKFFNYHKTEPALFDLQPEHRCK